MNTNQKNIGIGFWLAWVSASAIGFGLGAVLGTAIPVAARVSGIAFPILFGAIFGAIGALAQWIVIRGQAPESDLWVPFSAVVFMLSIVSAAGGSSNISPDFNPFFIVAIMYGLLGGFLQSLILEKRGIPIGWWIASSVIGGMLGCTMNGSAVAAVSADNAWQMGTTTFFLTWFRLGAPFGFGLGLVTGGALLWFSRHPSLSLADEAAMQGTR